RLQANGLARIAREREGGSRTLEERRGYVARVHTEPVGEEGEHRQRRRRDEPARVPLHAVFFPSGTIARAAPSVRMSPPIQIQDTMRLTCTFTVACDPSRAKSPRTR